jgi:hypothetical protein
METRASQLEKESAPKGTMSIISRAQERRRRNQARRPWKAGKTGERYDSEHDKAIIEQDKKNSQESKDNFEPERGKLLRTRQRHLAPRGSE